jgi:PAS domain S-box-containing protein
MPHVDFLRIIADNTRDVISIFDPMFVRMYVSPSVNDLIGYSPSEIISMTVNQPIPLDDAAYVGPVVRTAIEKGESCTVEHRLIHKNGTVVWVEVVVRPIFSQSGKLAWILTSARNISDRKSKERELETERRLRQELYSISSLSHEIRTPLAILVSTLELLRESAQEPEHVKLLNTLDSVSHTLSALVNNVLDYARLREGKSHANFEDFDLYELCDNVLKVHSTVAEDKGLHFSVLIDKSVPRNIYCDAHKLKQILTNLVSNAIKFTATGSVLVNVNLEGPDLTFEISDTGIGIPTHLVDEIFEPFMQQSGATEKHDGSGLGLSIVKSLLSLLSGNISVQSKINEGSKFVFRIPFVPATHARTERGRGDIGGMKLLFVDDLLISQDLHKRLFEKAGAYCHVCSNVAQSLALDALQTFDVILLDVHTSDQNSLPFIGSLKTKFPGAQVIVYTADASDDVVTTAKLFGAADFICKPVDFKILLETISRYKRGQILDLAIYEDIYHSDQEEYFRAIALLLDEFNFFEKEFKRCLDERDSKGFKKVIHRIKPIAKQTKCTTLIKLLASDQQFEAPLEWERLEKSRDAIAQTVDSILSDLMRVQANHRATSTP